MKKIFLFFFAFCSMHLIAQVTPASLGIKITHSIACTPVKDQYMSSTCWSFASNSFIESELMFNNKLKVDLSEMYVARYSYINKFYKVLVQEGNIYFTPGGQFHDVIKVIKKYGIVPEEAYPGKPNGELNYDHSKLDTIMKQLAQKLLADGKKVPSASDLIKINEILDEYIGKVPSAFIYKGNSYTPQTFAKEVLHFNADDYVEITSYTHHPFYTSFVLEDKYNWTSDKYYNVPLTDFMSITDSALAKGFSVCWDGDAQEKGFQYYSGVAMLDFPVKNFTETRQQTFEDKSTSLDHMMHIVGTATDKLNNKWYLVKNSWGISNKEDGYLFMQEDYYKIKTVAIIVNKNAVPVAIRKKMRL